jgi:DNA-binding LacI/PurR family transcriptional regulator
MTARENGLHLIVTALPDRQLTDPQFAPKMLRESMADGLLINYYREIPDQMEDLIVRYRVPSIWTNARREADCAYPDDFGASRRATQRLIQRGHRRIAYVDCTHDHPLDPRRDHYSAFDRHAGYLAAMQEAALPASTFLPGRKLQGSAVSLALRDWLSLVDRPSAVVTYCSVDVLGLLQVAPSLGVKVPEDLTLVTHEEPESLYGVAPVTTMLIPARELGRIAVEMLKDKIAEPARKLPPRAVEFGVQEAEG